MNRFLTAVPVVVVASILIFTVQAQSPRSRNVKTLKLKAKGLLPNTAFAVFLAADHIGEIETNADGRGSMRAESRIEFDSLHQVLPPAVLRFASPVADDVCFTPVYGEVKGTAFIRKSAAVTTTWITGAQSVNDDGSIFHTIDWRSIQCVSTF